MFKGPFLIDMAHSGGFSMAASLVDSKRDNEKSCCGIFRFTYKILV